MSEFGGQRYISHRKVGTATSGYIKIPTLGTGVFEILSMSLHPSGTQHFAMPAALQFNWTDGVDDCYRFLKYGYIGSSNGLEVKNEIVVGPGTIQAWIEDPTTYGPYTVLDVTYRRIATLDRAVVATGGFRWW